MGTNELLCFITLHKNSYIPTLEISTGFGPPGRRCRRGTLLIWRPLEFKSNSILQLTCRNRSCRLEFSYAELAEASLYPDAVCC